MTIDQSARDAAAELHYTLWPDADWNDDDGGHRRAERDRIALGYEDSHPFAQAFHRAIDAARAQQREADAKVAENRPTELAQAIGRIIAAAIREGSAS